MEILDATATAQALPYPALIQTMGALFAAGMSAPDRHHHTLPMAAEPDGTLLLMPAWDAAIGCVKIVNVTPGNGARNLPAVAGSVLVFDRRTGRHLTILDGAVLTARRTAAASALAAKHLARPDASRLLLIGAGTVAAQLPAAFHTVRPLSAVSVWARNRDRAEQLARALAGQGWPASVCTDLEAGVKSHDIVSAATLATSPIVKGQWLQPGQHVDLIGAFTPTMREADDTALQRARIFVDTPFAAHEAGELKIPLESGAIAPGDILGDLHDLCAGRQKRQADDEITVFKSTGNAIMDLAAAKVSQCAHTD